MSVQENAKYMLPCTNIAESVQKPAGIVKMLAEECFKPFGNKLYRHLTFTMMSESDAKFRISSALFQDSGTDKNAGKNYPAHSQIGRAHV